MKPWYSTKWNRPINVFVKIFIKQLFFWKSYKKIRNSAGPVTMPSQRYFWNIALMLLFKAVILVGKCILRGLVMRFLRGRVKKHISITGTETWWSYRTSRRTRWSKKTYLHYGDGNSIRSNLINGSPPKNVKKHISITGTETCEYSILLELWFR